MSEEKAVVAHHAYFHQFLLENNERLTGIIAAYVVRMGLARGENVRLLANEVFQDTALELLVHADRLDPERPPHAWFLRVAANILKRKRATFARRYRFEVLVSDLAEQRQVEDEENVLEGLVAFSSPGPEQQLESQEHVKEMLALVSPGDADMLRLSLLEDLSAETIAERLGLRVGTVRVRLHRAQQRLKIAWRKREDQEKRGQK